MKLMGRSDGLLIVFVFVFFVSSEVFKLISHWTEGRGHMVRLNIFLFQQRFITRPVYPSSFERKKPTRERRCTVRVR